MDRPVPPAGALARRLLLVFIGTALVPLVVTVWLSTWSSQDVVANLLEENLGKTARITANALDDFLAEKTALLTALGSGLTADDTVLAGVVRRSEVLEELLLLDAGGVVLARSQADDTWALAACRAQREGITPMTHAHHGAGHEVVITVPTEQGGRLCGRVRFTLHQEMISERAASAFGGLAYIVDRSGQVVCHAFEEGEPHIHPGEQLLGPAGEHAARGVPWQGIVVVDGQEHLASYAPASALPWGVWAEVPLAQASGVLRPHSTRALLFGSFLVLGLSGVIFLVVRSFSRDFDGMSDALAASVRDLDAKVVVRTAELEDARHFSDTLLDTLEQRILVIGPDRQVIRANRAALEAYGPKVVGLSCRNVHGTAEGVRCPAEDVLQSGARAGEEKVRRLPDGRVEILAVERYPIPGVDGPRAVLEIERDVTELKHFQAHLVHREKMAALGTLAAGLAHEIGNPLASLSSELELLAMEPSGAAEAVPVLQEQVRRMGRLLRELVELGRTPSDQNARFLAMAVVDDVLRMLRHGARDKNVTLQRGDDLQLTLCSSRDRMLQVLLNLGLNAVDAVAPGGTVTFEVERRGTGLAFVVRDDGPGLPRPLERLFEPFFTTKAVGEGAGLGLFVVDRVVTALRGQVTARDEPAGGARFDVIFADCSCEGRDGG